MATGDKLKTTGKYCMIAGGATFFLMALSTTVIFDVIFIYALTKQANQAERRASSNPVGAGMKFAATYMLWNLISKSTNPFVLFLLSPFVSIAAAALAVALDVSFIAWGIAAGWGLGLALVLVGYGLYRLGQHLNQEKPPATPPSGLANQEERGYLYNTMRQFGLFEVLPTAMARSMQDQNGYTMADAQYAPNGATNDVPIATPVY